jgi:Substrate binding domain of ABC-type glycine betaine transport system
MKIRGVKAIVLSALCASAVVSCGSSSSSSSGAAKCSGLKGDPINVVQNAWTASAVEAAIMKQLIESQLCTPAKIVEIDENTQFQGLADGKVDFVTELWKSGVVAEEQAFIDNKSVVEVGKLGTVGQIGWYVPDYVAKDHPEVATWEGLKKPEIAKLFATAESGDKGSFLGTDPSYSAYDEPIINSLGLPFKVRGSGQEADPPVLVDANGNHRQVQAGRGQAAGLQGWLLRRSGQSCLRLPGRRPGEASQRQAADQEPEGVGDARQGADHQCPAARVAAPGRDRQEAGRRRGRYVDRGQRGCVEALVLITM